MKLLTIAQILINNGATTQGAREYWEYKYYDIGEFLNNIDIDLSETQTLDIDGNTISQFDATDQSYLEKIVLLI